MTRGRSGLVSLPASRRGALAVLMVLTAVVTAGTVVVLAVAQAAATPWEVALPLLLIGVAAIPASGAELARLRRQEFAVARLRGTYGWRLLTWQLAEPMTAIVLGALIGLGLGLPGGRVAVAHWVAQGADVSHWRSIGGAVAVVLLALIAVAAGGAATRREPLADLISPQARPRPPTVSTAFGAVLVVVAAVVSVYRARQAEDPDLLVYAGPALVGLAVGQGVVWLVRGLARLLLRHDAGRSLGGFLAGRRLARAADVGTALRLVVAAGTVAILAISATAAVTTWSSHGARLRAGAPEYFVLDATPQQAMRLAERLDPDGRLLVPAVVALPATAWERRAFVDTTRYRAALGDFDSGPLADPDQDLADASIAPTGAGFVLRTRVDPAERTTYEVELSYLSTTGRSGTLRFWVRAPQDAKTEVVIRRHAPGCRRGCYPEWIDVTGYRFSKSGRVLAPGNLAPLELREFRLGNTDLGAVNWVAPDASDGDPSLYGDVMTSAAGNLVLQPPRQRAQWPGPLHAVATPQPLPVLQTTGLVDYDGERVAEVLSPGGNPRVAKVRTHVAQLPLVEGAGMVGDLASAVRASSPLVPSAEVRLLAAPNLPASVRADLVESGAERHTLASVQTEIETESGAVKARASSLIAGCCLLVALLTLLAGQRRQRAAFVRDAAALRVVGVSAADLRSAARRETVLFAGLGTLGALAGGVVASWLLLPSLPLVSVSPTAIALSLRPSWPLSMAIAGLIAATLAVLTIRARRLDPTTTRPATILRDRAEST